MVQKQSSDKIIWGVTILLALAMVGGAYLYKRSNEVVVTQAPVIAPETYTAATTEPEPQPQMTMPEIETLGEEEVGVIEESLTQDTTQMATPAKVEKRGKAVLNLDNLAGLIEISVPFLNVRNKMPLEHSCFRQNISPALSWSNAPEQTQSYIVFMEHRDSLKKPEDYDLYWLAYNIDAQTLSLAEAQPKQVLLDSGVKQALNYENMTGYSGPCQPQGEYDYALRVFALDTVLDIPGGVDRNTLIHAMNGHIIDMAEAEFVHYRRL